MLRGNVTCPDFLILCGLAYSLSTVASPGNEPFSFLRVWLLSGLLPIRSVYGTSRCETGRKRHIGETQIRLWWLLFRPATLPRFSPLETILLEMSSNGVICHPSQCTRDNPESDSQDSTCIACLRRVPVPNRSGCFGRPGRWLPTTAANHGRTGSTSKYRRR